MLIVSFFFFKYGFSICELLHLLMDWISFGRFFSELKKNFLKTDVSQRLCFWSYSFIEAFWLWFWGSGPAGWMRPPSTFRPHPPCALVFVLILLCPDCSFETQGPAHLFLLPLICDQLDSVFQWKEFFFILQVCKILLGCIFLQIFFASRSLKGFSLSFAFLYPYDFFISFSSFFCSRNSCRMDVGFCISWLWIFLCFLTLLLW